MQIKNHYSTICPDHGFLIYKVCILGMKSKKILARPVLIFESGAGLEIIIYTEIHPAVAAVYTRGAIALT